MTIDGFVGNWTYRSFRNRAELDAAADDVLLATADLTSRTEGASATLSFVAVLRDPADPDLLTHTAHTMKLLPPSS